QVCRRDATGADVIVGRVLKRIEGAGSHNERELGTAGAWFEAATDVFGLNLSGIEPADRERLWRRIRVAHEARLAARDATDESAAPASASP
ncbi:MAG: hypothetical protein ACRDSS_09630, partial [Actinocrinis sp.]